MKPHPPAAVVAVARIESVRAKDLPAPVIEETDRLEETTVPYLLDSLCVVDLEVDYKELIDSLRNQSDLNQVSARNVTVVFNNAENELNVWQLASLAGTLLSLCDGRHTVTEITHELGLLQIEVNEIPLEKVCIFGLMQLLEDGFIGLSSAPLTRLGEDSRRPHFSFPPKSTNTQQPWPLVE